MKVETATPDGKKTARIKISFRDGQLQSPKVQIKNPSELRDTSAICEQNTETSSNNRSTTSKNGSLRKEVNESLSNLRQDISSMIEQSFGSVQVNIFIYKVQVFQTRKIWGNPRPPRLKFLYLTVKSKISSGFWGLS